MKLSFLSLALAAVLASGTFAQTPPPAPKDPKAPVPAQKGDQKKEDKKEDKKQDDKKEDKKEDKRTDLQKKYDEILKKATVQDGVYKVLRTDDRVYWQIPIAKLGRLLFWQTEIAEIPKELGYPGTAVGTRTLRFTRRENKLQLRNVTFSTRASGTDEGTNAGIAANTIEPILYQFDFAGESPEGDALIDVTQLFISDPADFSIRGAVAGFQGVDPSKTYIDRVKAFPTNIETRTSMTVRIGGGRPSAPANPFAPQSNYDASTATLTVHYSLTELPEKPMMGRLKDSRIGYFTTGYTEFGRNDDPSSKDIEYINRFRLEKKDPNAALSEPVKPITFYLAREVPVRWRPYIKAAVEDWNVAFEAAGFKNAIVCKNAPTVKEDPDWDAEDARYSVIRWAPSEVANAMGPSVQDPRSGETISAHVIIWNDVVKLVQNWYFAQAGAIDPQAQKLPLPEPLIGRLLRYVVSHEVGHTLGLEHNFRASVAYSTKQLRDPQFTKENGVASSIMSYSRYNYVAQPGDGVTQTIGMIGPYDKFAIEYGYKPLTANNPEDETRQLDLLLSKQIRDPYLRFGNYKYSGIDPTTQSELIGEDQVESTRLGIMNLERIARNTLFTGTTRFGEDYDRLSAARGQLVSQYLTELTHVVAQVGGVVENDVHSGRVDTPVFTPVPEARQKAAVKLLIEKGLFLPAGLSDPAILAKITPMGSYDANPAQGLVLNGLLSESRLRRMADNEVRNGKNAYTISELTTDVFRGVFPALYAPAPKAGDAPITMDANTRALHRNFLRSLDGRLNGSSATKTDMKALAKMELRNLAKAIDAKMPFVKDSVTAAHLAETRSDIVKILGDTYSKPGAAPAFNLMDLLMGGGIADDKKGLDAACWSPKASEVLREMIRDAANAGQ